MNDKLTCFSFSCAFTCESEIELKKHEQKHKEEFEQLKRDNQDGDPEENDCI